MWPFLFISSQSSENASQMRDIMRGFIRAMSRLIKELLFILRILLFCAWIHNRRDPRVFIRQIRHAGVLSQLGQWACYSLKANKWILRAMMVFSRWLRGTFLLGLVVMVLLFLLGCLDLLINWLCNFLSHIFFLIVTCNICTPSSLRSWVLTSRIIVVLVNKVGISIDTTSIFRYSIYRGIVFKEISPCEILRETFLQNVPLHWHLYPELVEHEV